MDKPIHRNTVEFQVSGKYALFTDVLTRTGGEHCTYMIPTYEALKGILHSIYWKPTLIWYIDAVRVINPIRTVRKGIRPIKYGGGNDLAYYTYLEDVCYQVRAHFEWNQNRPELECDRNEHKHHNIARHMIERGGRRDIFLGTRECQGYAEPCVFGTGEGAYDGTGEIPYSLMLHGFTYADEAENDDDKGFLTVRFWTPVMKDGIIFFPAPKDFLADRNNVADDDPFKKLMLVKRHIKKMEIKPFGQEHGNFSGLNEPELNLLGGDDFELDAGAFCRVSFRGGNCRRILCRIL